MRVLGLWDLKFLLYVYLHFKILRNFKNTSLNIRTNGLLRDNKISGWQRTTDVPWFFQDTVVLKLSRDGGTESVGIFPESLFITTNSMYNILVLGHHADDLTEL